MRESEVVMSTWTDADTRFNEVVAPFGEIVSPFGEIVSPFGEIVSPMREAEAPSNRWAGWGAVAWTESEADGPTEAGDSRFENQSAPPQPKVTTTFPPDALKELPDILRARGIVTYEMTVSTARVLWMLALALDNTGAEPGWIDRLIVDLVDLPKAGPTSTVYVSVFETVPFEANENDKLVAFHKFELEAHPSKVPPFDVVSVGHYAANRDVEEVLGMPAGSIAKGAGLPTQLSVDQAANYKLVVYAVLPPTVGMVVAPYDQRSLRGFAFDKSTLTDQHQKALDLLAREIVRSWWSRRIIKSVLVQGHTDPVGGRDYNLALGRRRAEAVAARLKELINHYAGRLPVGTVESIQYVIESYGEDRPISKKINSLNRRVEISLVREQTPPPTPLDLDITITRITKLLQTQTTLDPDQVQRLQCLLQKVRQPGMDDRYATENQVFLVMYRDNHFPTATEWSRALSTLLHPGLFSPQVSDDQVLINLREFDYDIGGGVSKMNQLINYASGADYGLGLMALSSAFKQFNKWVLERLKDPLSIYSCYADIFL
jgi:outer membrane protein OmpA-like peptidoglycan-associated protein